MNRRDLLSNEEGRQVILSVFKDQTAMVSGCIINGAPLSTVRSRVRKQGYSFPNADPDAIEFLNRTGFKVQKGFSRKSKTIDNHYCQPAQIVFDIIGG